MLPAFFVDGERRFFRALCRIMQPIEGFGIQIRITPVMRVGCSGPHLFPAVLVPNKELVCTIIR